MRTLQYPRGVPWMSSAMKAKVGEGNAMADFQKEVHAAAGREVVKFWTENPDGSFLWKQSGYEEFRSPTSELVARVDMCRFGTRWRKRTEVATNVKGLAGLRMMCCCGRGFKHTALRGQRPEKKVPWTRVAQAYPRGFSKLVADFCLADCGWGKAKRLNLAACSHCGHQRIGEAKNPGPRGPREARGYSLESRPIQTLATLRLGEDQWRRFLRWVSKCLRSVEPMVLFASVPLMLAHLLRRFGDLDFEAGGSLSHFRHLILAALRHVPTMRPYASICWELANRWSFAEPTEHRVPTGTSPWLLGVDALLAEVGWCFYSGFLWSGSCG